MPVRGLLSPAQPDQQHPGASRRQDQARPEPGASPPSDDEFLARYGDAIDDRVAGILDELLTERDSAREPWRLTFVLGVASLLLVAVAANVLFRHDPMAWVIWPATAVSCLAIAWSAAIRRQRWSARGRR